MRLLNKKGYAAAAVLLLAGMLTGCGKGGEDVSLHEMKVEKYVTLGDYRNIQAEAEQIVVDEAQCDELLANVYAGYATAENGAVERPVQEGDTVNIDYEGKLDGAAFDGGTAEGYDLTIGSGQFIPGFEDGLIGYLPGETAELTLTFPENYDASLAGKETVFTVTVNYIIPGNAEDMQDSVVALLGLESENVTTIAELRDYLKDALEQQAQSEYESNLQDDFLNKLIEQSTFKELPESMVNSYKELMTKNIENTAVQYGVDADTYMSYTYGMTCADFVNTYVEDLVKQDIAMQAIANRENLTVEDAELDEKLQNYADQGGYSTVEEFMGELGREQYRNYFMNEKVMNFILGE